MKYGLTLVTAPTTEPVTEAEAAEQVRVNAELGNYRAELRRLITASRVAIERLTNRQLINATWDLKLDGFPCGFDSVIYVPKAPLSSVASITYIDAAGASQTLATSVYKVITSREPGEIRLKFGQSWPSTYSEPEVVTVRFVAGYGATAVAAIAARPEFELLRQAMLLLITDWFEGRSSEGEIGMALQALLAQAGVGDEFHAYAV